MTRESRLRRGRFAGLLGLSLALIILLVALGPPTAAGAQSGKSFHWTRYDYTVDILENGDMLFTVLMGFSFDSGSFSQGYYEFEMNRLQDVRDVSLREGSQEYRQVGSEQIGGFTAEVGDMFSVLWWFPPTADAERTFTLSFRVVGGLRIYPDGDQFYWNFYAGDRPGRIESGTITLHLPGQATAEQLILAADPDTVAITQVDASTVQARVDNLPANRQVVLRVQFPHGMVQASASPWQAAEDRQTAYDEQWRPIVNLVLLGLSALVLLGGVGGVIALWYTRGRDKPVGLVAEYVSEPPSDLPPGLVGSLVDEKVDIQDILATIVDLGRKGALEIQEEEEKGFLGIGSKKDFTYRRLPGTEPLLGYEQVLLKEFFGGASEISLSSLKNRFYSAIPRISSAMYEELTKRGLFVADPQKTRNRYYAIGIGGLVLSFGAFICLAAVVAQYADTFMCLPLALGAAFVTVLIVAGAMAKKTEAGATEAAGWNAFKRYLKDIERYDDLQEKKDIFERYLPYAIAFGMQRDYIRKFSAVQAPAPRWYYPYPPIIYGGPRPVSGLPGDVTGGGAGGGGLPSLQGMSDGMAGSLQSMSDGLVSMLNSASSTLTSQPRSSGSGGGGFSGGGGGFSGGGGGGGGSGAR